MLRFSSSVATPTAWCHVGEGAVLLRFGAEIDTGTSKKLLSYMKVLDDATPLEGVKVHKQQAHIFFH